MITNLFSIFDPSTRFLNLNWISLYISILFIFPSFWNLKSRILFFFIIIFNYIIKELKNIIKIRYFRNLILFLRFFIFIIFNNLIGIHPYIFTSTRHLRITLSLAFPFWLLFLIWGWINITNHIFCHLVPLGTPIILRFFIVCIETIRNIIRPITLSVRLAANIIAGHLLLSLLSSIRENNPFIFLPSRIFLLALILLEYAVAIIQSYVFITLISLYLNEIN
jgi:F-type H+-transporting ATPase subunit a